MNSTLYGSELHPNILLAEDDPTQLMMLEHVVATVGYKVRPADDGASALELLLKHRFDILITDLDMPGLNGQELCQRVRAASLGHYVYILMLTARTTDEAVIAGLDAGADDFLRKPVHQLELQARIKNAARMVGLLHTSYQQSIIDRLSGLYNRGYLIDHLRDEVERAQRFGRSLALVMIDIDFFKRINDGYGHAGGDRVVKVFCRRLFALIRKVDWAARYGGEEFVLVLPETSLEHAKRAAEKWRQALAAEPIDMGKGAITVTASFGVAQLMNKDSSDSLLRRADAALYQSKAQGRNRVTALPSADASEEKARDPSS